MYGAQRCTGVDEVYYDMKGATDMMLYSHAEAMERSCSAEYGGVCTKGSPIIRDCP
jgi:hypothetical protein